MWPWLCHYSLEQGGLMSDTQLSGCLSILCGSLRLEKLSGLDSWSIFAVSLLFGKCQSSVTSTRLTLKSHCGLLSCWAMQCFWTLTPYCIISCLSFTICRWWPTIKMTIIFYSCKDYFSDLIFLQIKMMHIFKIPKAIKVPSLSKSQTLHPRKKLDREPQDIQFPLPISSQNRRQPQLPPFSFC